MKVYMVRQRSEIVSGYELDFMPNCIYGIYKEKQEAKKIARQIAEKLIKRNYKFIKGDMTFNKRSYAYFNNGNYMSWWKEHHIEIVPIQLGGKIGEI